MKSKVVHHRSEILISLAKEVLFSPDEFGACSIPCSDSSTGASLAVI